MLAYYPRTINTSPNYLVNNHYSGSYPQQNAYAPFPYTPIDNGALYQQSQYCEPEANPYGKPFTYGNPYESAYNMKSSRSVSSSSVRGVGSYSSNGTMFFMPNIPVDHGDFVSKQQHQHQYHQAMRHQQQQHQQQPQQQQSDTNVVGGVSATLDYELDEMAEFVSNMALGIMGPYSTEAKSERPSQEFLDAFHKFTNQVLTATRLPKATVILALVYLSKRWALGNIPTTDANVHIAYKLLVVALLLANKFHDDNTFTNKSWNEATGVPVQDLNIIERNWLKSIQWSLHLNQSDRKGWEKWNDCWEYWVASRRKSAAPTYKPSMADFSNTRYSETVSRSVYPSPAHSPEAATIGSDKVRQLLASPAPSYTIPKWFSTASNNANSARPNSASRSSSISPASSASSINNMNNSEHFVSYFQQSFAGSRQFEKEKYANYGNHHMNAHHNSSSFYVPSYGSAACNCNYCSFDSAPQFSKWYGCATAC